MKITFNRKSSTVISVCNYDTKKRQLNYTYYICNKLPLRNLKVVILVLVHGDDFTNKLHISFPYCQFTYQTTYNIYVYVQNVFTQICWRMVKNEVNTFIHVVVFMTAYVMFIIRHRKLKLSGQILFTLRLLALTTVACSKLDIKMICEHKPVPLHTFTCELKIVQNTLHTRICMYVLTSICVQNLKMLLTNYINVDCHCMWTVSKKNTEYVLYK